MQCEQGFSVTLMVLVAASCSNLVSHTLLQQLEQELRAKFNVIVSVHSVTVSLQGVATQLALADVTGTLLKSNREILSHTVEHENLVVCKSGLLNDKILPTS